MACKTATWLAELDDDDRTQFNAWTGKLKALHDHCKTAGFPGGLTATKDHKRQRCSCE